MKETTAMIRAGHQFVEDADRALLAGVDLDIYATEALSSHFRPLDSTEQKVRASNLWGQDRERRLRAVLDILRSWGVTADTQKRNESAERTINRLVDLETKEVLQTLGCT